MAVASEVNEKIQPMWQIVPLTEYALPLAPKREAAARGITALWRLIRAKEVKQQPPEKTEDQLHTFSETELSRLVPAIDWHSGAEALDAELKDWPGQENKSSPIRFFICPPYGGHADILNRWAEMHRMPVVKPPSPEQILARDETWFSDWSGEDQTWVLPSLERCYLRHAEGLTVISRFFERAFSGKLGSGLVGCDSWAWSFFQKIWAVAQPVALTMQAFDSERLRAYFSELAVSSALDPLRFRESDSGKDVLPTRGAEKTASSETSPFLKHLAAYSRGILGIAWMYWRTSLCAVPDKTPESSPQENNAGYSLPQNTVWLRAGLKELEMPVRPHNDIAFVLHCLLLHNGLPVDLLVELLPLSQGAVTATLHLLASANLVEAHNNAWRISALGYPVVRQFLKNNGYMVDLF